jgi:integrase
MEAAVKLTMKAIEDLVCPEGRKDALAFDDEVKGLGVRVAKHSKPGALTGKNYIIQFTIAGQKRRIPIGSCSAITLKAAREAARAYLGDVAKGKDPAVERKEARRADKAEALTLGKLVGQWEKLHLASRRPNYANAATGAIRRNFAKHLEKPADKLSKATVVAVLDGLTAAGKAQMAGATARYGRALFGWAMRRGSITTSPFEGVPIADITERERVLTDDEIKAIWQATEGGGTFNLIVRGLLLTGQRRDEVARMERTELASDMSLWTLPSDKAKNGAEHLVPLSQQARAVIEAAPRVLREEGERGPDFVFRGEGGVFSGWSKSKARLDKRSSVVDWTLHDLRRTCATGLQKLGVRLEVTEAVLNHVSGSRGGLTGIYQRHDWADEKRAALNAWGSHVESIVERREDSCHITSIRRSA